MGLPDHPGSRRCFEVDRGDLRVTRITETETRPPCDGEVLFGLDAIDDLYQSMLGQGGGSPTEAHLIEMG